MIEATVLRTNYFIEDTKTGNCINLEVTPNKITLGNEFACEEFVFTSHNSKKTREKWRNVAKLITKAIDMVERDAKQVKKFV